MKPKRDAGPNALIFPPDARTTNPFLSVGTEAFKLLIFSSIVANSAATSFSLPKILPIMLSYF